MCQLCRKCFGSWIFGVHAFIINRVFFALLGVKALYVSDSWKADLDNRFILRACIRDIENFLVATTAIVAVIKFGEETNLVNLCKFRNSIVQTIIFYR